MYDIWLHTIAFVENQLIYFFADLPLFLRSSTVEHPTLDLKVLIIVDFVRPRGQNFFFFFYQEIWRVLPSSGQNKHHTCLRANVTPKNRPKNSVFHFAESQHYWDGIGGIISSFEITLPNPE